MKHVCLLCRDRLNTWYSICNVSRCTPNNLALTSKTPTASDGEISKITFLNLRKEEKQQRENKRSTLANIQLSLAAQPGAAWGRGGCDGQLVAPLTGWAAARLWISARLSRGDETPCTSATPACSSWPCCRRVSLTACRGRQRHVYVNAAELDSKPLRSDVLQ